MGDVPFFVLLLFCLIFWGNFRGPMCICIDLGAFNSKVADGKQLGTIIRYRATFLDLFGICLSEALFLATW